MATTRLQSSNHGNSTSNGFYMFRGFFVSASKIAHNNSGKQKTTENPRKKKLKTPIYEWTFNIQELHFSKLLRMCLACDKCNAVKIYFTYELLIQLWIRRARLSWEQSDQDKRHLFFFVKEHNDKKSHEILVKKNIYKKKREN